ncbi:hypothetical protein L9F63_013105 [Diploptera punctata]|uniref:Arrestin C-terminal-like domain-containing protein n=1 Tax=Diploptera punctata TaxID=6984 RepID=A0AAD8EN60_DIPPU|nr:hypothetical protein L9F63_013105 [Diploptera punctata]
MPLYITFDNQQEAYFPGQEVKGNLNLNVSSENQVSSIVICFCGIGVLQRDEVDNKETKQELYFDQVSTVFSCKGEGDTKHHFEIGPKTFPFNFTLPQKIPTSFESSTGYVRYSITAYLEESDGRLQTAVAVFTVNAILDLNRIPKSRLPCTDWAQQDVCLFCFKCGPVSAILNIPRRGYVPGEYIPISAEINNLQNKPISFVKATLVQVVKYHHKSGPKKIKRGVTEAARICDAL